MQKVQIQHKLIDIAMSVDAISSQCCFGMFRGLGRPASVPMDTVKFIANGIHYVHTASDGL